jgi:hypothetical protein
MHHRYHALGPRLATRRGSVRYLDTPRGTEMFAKQQRDRRRPAFIRTIAGAAILMACIGAAEADILIAPIGTGPDVSPTNQSSDGATYFNAPNSGPFPAAPVTVGQVQFAVPAGQQINGAAIAGDFGSAAPGATAPVDLFLNGVEVALCNTACASASAVTNVMWSSTFSPADLFALSSGAATLTAVQRAGSQLSLGPTSLTINTSPVPLPAGLLLLGSGLAASFGLRRYARVTRRGRAAA